MLTQNGLKLVLFDAENYCQTRIFKRQNGAGGQTSRCAFVSHITNGELVTQRVLFALIVTFPWCVTVCGLSCDYMM